METEGEIMHSQSIAELTKALAKAQGEIKAAKKTAENPFYKSKYAELGDVWEACRDALSKNGLALSQGGVFDPQYGWALETTLMHTSGEWKTNIFPLKPTKEDPQGYKSANTYALRIGLESMVMVPGEDDDGNVASGKPALNTKEAAQEVARQKIADGNARIQAEAEARKQSDNKTTATPANLISEPQAKRLYAIARNQGLTEADLRDMLKAYGYAHTREVSKSKYDEICRILEQIPKKTSDVKKEATESQFFEPEPIDDDSIPF